MFLYVVQEESVKTTNMAAGSIAAQRRGASAEQPQQSLREAKVVGVGGGRTGRAG